MNNYVESYVTKKPSNLKISLSRPWKKIPKFKNVWPTFIQDYRVH